MHDRIPGRALPLHRTVDKIRRVAVPAYALHVTFGSRHRNLGCLARCRTQTHSVGHGVDEVIRHLVRLGKILYEGPLRHIRILGKICLPILGTNVHQ